MHLNCGHITCQPMQEFFLHLDLSVHGLVLPALLQTGLTLLSPGTRPQCPRSLLLPTSPFASSTSLGPDHSVHGLVHSTFLYTGLTKECHQVQGHSVQGPTSLQTDFKRSIIICDNKLELSLVVKVVKNISGK